MSHIHGLPPLPKSLSGFSFVESSHQVNPRQTPPTPVRSSSIRSSQGSQYTPTRQGSPGAAAYGSQSSSSREEGGLAPRKSSSQLDTQLAVLRREMYSLRQQDLSLLSQLWSLNESIQDFRLMLQEQRVLSPPSPSPTASSVDDDEFYMSSTSMGTPSGRMGRKLSRGSAASGSD